MSHQHDCPDCTHVEDQFEPGSIVQAANGTLWFKSRTRIGEKFLWTTVRFHDAGGYDYNSVRLGSSAAGAYKNPPQPVSEPALLAVLDQGEAKVQGWAGHPSQCIFSQHIIRCTSREGHLANHISLAFNKRWSGSSWVEYR